MTSAYDRFIISVHPENERLMNILNLLHLKYEVHDESQFKDVIKYSTTIFTVVKPVNHLSFSFPLISQFMSVLFPMGHIKSGTSMDKRIFQHFQKSEKWLKIRDRNNT